MMIGMTTHHRENDYGTSLQIIATVKLFHKNSEVE